MHEIIIRRVKFSNMLSYGNGEHEVLFDESGGLTWLKGPNGFGKSTIIEAITFTFFGSAYRKQKGSERPLPNKNLVNTANTKGKLRVEVEFDRIDSKGTYRYIIKRQMSKSGSTSFSINKDGIDEKKGAGITQKKIEDEILGFNKNLFEHVISLNTIHTKPIIELDTPKKRKLIESILTLSIDKFKELNGKELKQAQTKFDAATSDVEKYSKDTVELGNIITQMEQERADDIKELEIELDNLKIQVDEKKSSYDSITESLNIITNNGKSKKEELSALGDIDGQYKKLETAKVLIPQLIEDRKKLEIAMQDLVEDTTHWKVISKIAKESGLEDIEAELKVISDRLIIIPAKKASCESTIKHTKASMDELTSLAKELKSGVPCNTCGKPSTDDDVETIKSKYRDEWKSLKSILDKESNELSKFDNEILELESKKSNLEPKLEEAKKLHSNADEYYNLTVQTREYAVSSIKRDIEDKERKINAAGFDDVNEIEVKLTELDSKKEEQNKIKDELQNLRVELTRVKESQDGAKETLDNLQDRYDSLNCKIIAKKELKFADSLEATKKKREGALSDLETARNRVDKYSDKIAIGQYIAKMYSDNGIKQIVLGIFMPNLNRAVAYNMGKFNLPFGIRFTDSMDIEFSSRFGMAEIYDGLSEGQKRKINYAIALSFRDFVTSIADFKINALFLDEVLDISTDDEAFRDMVILTKEKMKEIGHVFMITHRGTLVEEQFDNIIEFSNDGRYSSFKQSELTPTKTNY